jgi:DNA-binding SARP family transcriptional activator
MPHLTLSCFGSFQATLDGEPLTRLHSAKAQALLAYLALEANQPHPREKLATLLWPPDKDTSARGQSHALSAVVLELLMECKPGTP